jgi:predicted lipoprotein with Yx(FWY)xxD motif
MVSNHPTYGMILTDSNGMTLYIFTKDTPNVSNCSGQCLVAWPPLLVTAGAPTKADGISGTLGTITLPDGTTQVTYNDMPLYYWAGDAQAGDATGYAVNNVWFTVHPDAPMVVVSDQAVQGDVVTITSVASFEPGWMVIHADANGAVGPVIGHTAVMPGWNGNVMVTIDTAMATENLYAMLHVDRGTVGTYEFPGTDVPVTVGGVMVNPRFFVTGLPVGPAATVEAEATVAATSEATVEVAAATEAPTEAATAEAATAEATAAPLLPTSGGAAAGSLALALAGAGALAAGGTLLLSRIRRR